MKIFGLEIARQRTLDRIVVQNIKPSTTSIARIPKVKPATLNYAQTYQYGRGTASGGDYDLVEVGKIQDTDAYVNQSFKKKLGLMFKEGVDYVGANSETIGYIKAREAQIARASNIPTLELKRRIAASLIRVSNAFLIKVRNEKASGGKVRKDASGRTMKPVAAYFPAAPETMQYVIDPSSGQIIQWKQTLPSGLEKTYSPNDVIHFRINVREGFIMGVPELVPVIDDIRALRQIEENIELLLYQHLFPLFHYRVGTETAPAGYTEDGLREIDVVIDQIKYMPAEGAIVTPERHEITAIGSEGRAIRAEGYLDHFKKRVFAGLGVSSVDMGEADTTNRATAFTLSRQLVDSIKDIQDALEIQWDHLVVAELLLESTFGDDVLEARNMVHLRFKEIDLQNKMELGKHYIDLFKANGITWDEFRSELGYEPIPVPSGDNEQDPKRFPDWFNTYWKLFEEPLNLIRAVDEPFSPAAKAMAESRSLALTAKQVASSQAEQKAVEQSKRAAKEKKSSNQDAIKLTDAYIRQSFQEFENDTIQRVQQDLVSRRVLDKEWLLTAGRTWATDVLKKMHNVIFSELLNGYRDQVGFYTDDAFDILAQSRQEFEDRIDKLLSKLITHTVTLIMQRIDEITVDVKLPEVQEEIRREVQLAFRTVSWRTDLIWDVELRKAYNFGRVLGMRYLGKQNFQLVAAPGACESCLNVDGRLVNVAFATIEDVPPLHPHSRMQLTVVDAGLTSVPQREPGQPAVAMPGEPDEGLSAKTGVCPTCGSTVIRQKRSNTYYCHKCNRAWDKEEIETINKGEA